MLLRLQNKITLKFYIWFVLLAALSYEIAFARNRELKKGGKNVCTFYQSKTVYATVKEKVSTVKTVEVCCSKWIACWKKCKRPRVSTKTITRTVSRLTKEHVTHCCEGYTVDSSGLECSTPICNPQCRNGGICVGPNKCRCQKGFEGRFCQLDIDECLTLEKTGCSQRCINLPGTYSCLCERGFVPGDPYSKTCKDINECSGLSDGAVKKLNPCRCYGENCDNVCQNTIGSYRCRCGEGFKLTVWNICVDRNECIETPDVCPQKCINTPGSYKCQCWNGFRWNEEKKTCQETNECSIGNGGCEHICHNVYGGHVCSCRNGFYLADDRFSCIDFNECNGPTECDSRTSTCVNTPGDYYCKCKNGFKFSQYDQICVDRDECTEKTALCNQKCQNTFGSYRCSCHPGYYLSSDRVTCKDLDECAEKKCDQICLNTPGSYSCFCKEGYMLDIDGKACKPKLCEVIQAPFYGSISCNGNTVGKTCSFSCNDGYQLDIKSARRCLPSGKWSIRQPRCIPNACKVPRPPANGKLLLPCDQSYGSTCPVSCNRGYVLRGPSLLKCEMEGSTVQWDIHKIRCEEILVCRPNPCKFGGKCIIVSPTKYSCNCSGTGHEGRICEVGVISVPRFPKMRINDRTSISLAAKPNSYVQISMFPEDDSINVAPDTIMIRKGEKPSRFLVTGRQGGLKSLSYEITSGEPYKTPRKSLFLVYNQADLRRSKVDSLSGFVSGCYELAVKIRLGTCPDVKIRSTKPWSLRSFGPPVTNGLAAIQIGNMKFPLAVPGVDANEMLSRSSKLLEYRINKQSRCPKRTLTSGQLQYIAHMDVFAAEFIKQFNSLMPAWFRVENTEKLKSFSEENIRAFIWSGEKLLQHESCSALAVERTGNFLVYVHHENLQFKVHGTVLRFKTKKAFCFAVDLCRIEAHLQIPEEHMSDVIGLLSFKELSSLGWKLNIKSVGFAKTARGDSRKCLSKHTKPGSRRILFGESKIEYKNNKGINAMATGDLFLGFKQENGKEIIDIASSCIDGNSLVETPAWKTTDLNDNIYERNKDETNVINLVKGPADNRKSIWSVIQKGGSVFKVKSGMRPIIKKSSRDINVNLKYKQTESSASTVDDSSLDKLQQLDLLSFVAMDLELAISGIVAPSNLRVMVSELQSRVGAWYSQLLADVEALEINIDDRKLAGDKARENFYKAKQFDNDLDRLLSLGSSSIDQDSIDAVKKSQNELKVVIIELEKYVKSAKGTKVFHTLTVNFNSSMCLFKPCMLDLPVAMKPLSSDITKQGFCHDPSKTQFQMWNTEAAVFGNHHMGRFFKFSTGDKFFLCLSVDGVKKGKFTGALNVLGNSLKTEFLFEKPKITVPVTDYKVFGKYNFKVNGTVDATLNKWEMLSVMLEGKADQGSTFVRDFQRTMDRISVAEFVKLQSKQRKINRNVVDLEAQNGFLRSKLFSDQQTMRGASRRYEEAKRRLASNKGIIDQQRRIFAAKRREYRNLGNELNKICALRKCPLQCIRMNECNVCQDKIYGKKTVPKCKTEFQTRSYAYKDSVKSTCSHLVQDRRLKYTGNCKEPQLEANARKRILDELKKKQKNNQSLTIEDALNLELVHKESGQKLLKAIQKQNFFKSFPKKLQNEALTEADFEKLGGYTNSSFVAKIRQHLKGVKLQKLIKELSLKMQQGEKLADEDYERVKKIDPEVAKKLKSNEAVQDIFLKIKTGKTLNDADLELLKTENPEFYENYTRASSEREVLVKIERKLQRGNITAADLEELAKINPQAAEKLKEALKEQLLKKVDEMKNKMAGVKNSLDSGLGSGNISSLSEKLGKLTKNVKPFDRAGLQRLQEKIKQVMASKGSIFEEVFERFDLALEVQNVTGSSSDLKRTLNNFFSSLDRFNLNNIFKQSQNLISERLQDLQKWFDTASKFIETLCSKCDKNCNKENAIQNLLSEIKNSVGKFENGICKLDLDTREIKQICQLVKRAKSFSQTYITRKSQDCREIKSKLVTELNNIAKAWKNLRNSNAVLFDNLWKRSPKTKSTISSYVSLSSSIRSAVRSVSSNIKLPLPNQQEIETKIARILRPGVFRLQDTEYLVSRVSIMAFKEVIKLMPVDAKSQTSLDVAIPSRLKASTSRKFKQLLSTLPQALVGLCSKKSTNNEIKQEEDRLKNILRVVEKEFDKMLSSRKLSKFFSASQRFASVLEHSLTLAENIKSKKQKCVAKYQPPLAKLNAFLQNVQNFDFRNYKDIAKGIQSTLKGIGNGIKAPIGKLMDQFEKIAIDTPSFDLPLMLTLNPDYFKLSISSLEDYLQMMSKAFSALVEISKKCKQCKLEDVFGKYNLKEITKKFDGKLEYISKKISKFMDDIKFNVKGSALFISSIEQIRTNLQRVYKSETGLSKESLTEIAETLKTAKEATSLIQKGQYEFILTFAGTKNKEIFTIVQELTALKTRVYELYDKSKGSKKELETLHRDIKLALSKIPSISGSIESLKKGSVEKRLETIKNVANIVKDLAKTIPKVYKKSSGKFLKYFENDWLPSVGKHLDKIEDAKAGLFSKTQTFLEDVGLVKTAGQLGISGIKTNARPKQRYSQFLKRLQTSPASRKTYVMREMARKAKADETLMTRFTNAWKNLYENVTGKVDKIKAKVTSLREKFDKYAVIFKDVQNTVDEIKKGPVSEVGKVKDLIEGFSAEFENYDFKSVMTSDPGVLKQKLREIKEIFRLSGDVFDKTDQILRKCKSCKVENIFGYRFIKDFAGKFEKKLSVYYDYLNDFADKFSAGVSEVQNITSAVGKMRDRFRNVFEGKKFGSDMLKDLASALRSSTGDIERLQDSAEDLGRILLGRDIDLQVLRASYDGLVGQLENVIDKSSKVAKNVETVYKQAKELGKSLDELDSQIGSLKKGPLETRIAIATDISKGIKEMMKSLPAILDSSGSTLESAGINADWVRRFATGMSTVTGKLEKVLDKTDSVLLASGVLLDGKKNISKQLSVMKNGLQDIKEAPWHKKIDVARDIASKAGQIMDTALDSAVLSGNALNLALKKKDLLSSLQSVVSEKRLAELRKISSNAIETVEKLQKGPISEIGKLTDSVENFVDGLKGFDIGKAILSDPASLKEKVTELQQLADGTADILVSISDITGVCKNCNIDNILGKGFMKKISKNIGETFDSLYKKVKDIGRRAKLGHSGWNNLVTTAGKISDGFSDVIKDKKITPETFRSAAKELRNSAQNLQGIKESSSDIFKAIFDNDEDMKGLQKNFEGLVDTVSSVMNKTAEFSDDVETAYETVNDVRETFKSISNNFNGLQKGPLDARVDAVRKMVAGVRGLLTTMPRLMNESAKVGSSLGIDSRFLHKLSNGLLGFTKDVDSVFKKTDLSLKDAGIAVQNLNQISETAKELSDDFKSILNAPLKDKFTKINNMISKVDGVFGQATKASTAIDSILKRTLNTDFNITSGLSKIATSASGFMQNISKGVQHVESIYKDIASTVDKIKSGPVTKIGALTDSVTDFVKSIKSFNIAEILVLSPKFATEKFGDIKDIIKDSGAILNDISSIVTKACPSCNMDELFGSKFFVNIKDDLTTGFDKLVGNATKFLNKVGEGAEGVAGIVNAVNGIENQLSRLRGIKFNADGINTLSGILDSSSDLVASIKGDSSKVFNALFDKNKDMLMLKGKFEGLVTNVGSFLKNAGKVTAKVEDAFAKVDEVKKSFDTIESNFKNVGEGPLEERVKAAKNIINGVMSITSGLPDLFNSTSLGLKSTGFLRRFGAQLSEVTEGVNKVLTKTNGFITDVGTTVDGINNIGKISSEIGSNFQEILRAPTAQKLRLVQKTVDQIKDLTGEVNKLTGGVSKAVKKITGKTILSTSLFGNSTQNVLDDISNAVGIITDRYDQFQTLTKTFSKAFKDISSDPINFAVNELPKLFNQTEGFLKTIIGDTKAIADKLGIKLDNINLDPALVSTAKQFYGFAKGALGTFQSGQKLFTDFQNLFNSKDFKSGLQNLQKLTASGKNFISSLDSLGDSLFKEKWTKIKGNFNNMLGNIGTKFGINLQKAGDLFNKGMSVAGDAFGIYSDIKTLFNIKELNAQTIMQSANAVIGIAQKATNILNTFGANIQTKTLESVSNYIGTAAAVFQIAKGIYDFVGWVNDVCDITYETKIVNKELRYICLKTKIKEEFMKIPIDKCRYETVQVRRGFGSANFCCNGTKCVYLQNKACLQANDRCLKNRLSFVKSSSKFDKMLAEAYEKFETADLAMTTAQIDIKAAENLKKRYEISYNRTLALYRLNRLGHSRAIKNKASVSLAVSILKKLINQNANTSTLTFEAAEFNVNLYSQNQVRIPITFTYKEQSGIKKTLNFTVDFSNVQQTFEHTVKWLLAEMTQYSIPRKRRSLGYVQNTIKNTPAPLKCKAFTENMELYVDVVERLKSSVDAMYTGRSYSRLRRSKDIKMSKTPSEARNQLIKELILLSSSTRTSLGDIISGWVKDSELKISQALDGKCAGLSECVQAWKDDMIQLFDASLQNYKEIFRKFGELARILIELSSGRMYDVAVKASIKRSLNLVHGLNYLKSVCDNVPVFTVKPPSSIVAYNGMEFELKCSAEASSAAEYQWFVNKTVLPGFNERILSISNVDADDEGSYYCQATNAAGTAQSDAVFVKIAEKIAFVEQLQDVAMPVSNPERIELVCNVTTVDDLTFTWWKQFRSGRVRKLRQNSALLDLGVITESKSGVYWCEASNGYESIRSRKATVSLVRSLRRHQSVQLEIDIKSEDEFMVCDSPSIKHLNAIKMSVMGVLKKEFEFSNTQSNITVDYRIAKKKEDAKLIVSVSLIPQSENGDSDEDLAAEDAKIQVKMRKVINEFWDKEENIKFRSNECSYLLVESTAVVTWNADHLNCPVGLGLTQNNLRCLPCLPGNFDNGMSRCKQCPLGSYQPRFGQSNCIPCSNGKLTSLPGNLDASLCSKSDFKCYDDMNIMVALDTSANVSQQGLAHTKTFVKKFINSFDLAQKGPRFSLATFDDVAQLKVAFGTYESATGLNQEVSKISKLGNSRRTDLLLDLAADVFNSDLDASVRRVLIIITNGPQTSVSDDVIQNKSNSLKGLGMEIFYIGVGENISAKEAIMASSSPKEEHFIKLVNYLHLSSSATFIANSVCHSGQT